MRLNLQSDYALRLLMHLAVNPDQLITISEVAKAFGISKNHLMKVAHIMSREGYIKTVRGRTGGMRLGRTAAGIGVGEVIRHMEADFALVECMPSGADGCGITPACRLKVVINEALESFWAILDQYTIRDLVENNDDLRVLLRSP